MPRTRSHLRRNAVAYVALFLALGGGAYAAAIAPKNSVVSRSIKNGQARSADVRNDALRGIDIRESTLGPVPRAASAERAADSLRLEGTPASDFQRRITADCDVRGISGVAADGTAECSSAVMPVSAKRPDGEQEAISLGPSSLQLLLNCQSAGNIVVSFRNVGSGPATVNWMFSEGGATVNASGVALNPGNFNLNFVPTLGRLEGQWIFAEADAVTTVKLHAFDGNGFCEVNGTAAYAGA